ncbi:hypothetical protein CAUPRSCDRAFT_10517 [Caulochytrium protostelioides]|uniref:Uncharacterized protein n=1 Tax=Caulochytrium protostelioides TaxID=1555241 RepID=A0A4P9WZK2_9FUNG|nr:hypothetical protein CAUPRSCDRAFT_10517 [Caulochytrium protostelioides]
MADAGHGLRIGGGGALENGADGPSGVSLSLKSDLQSRRVGSADPLEASDNEGTREALRKKTGCVGDGNGGYGGGVGGSGGGSGSGVDLSGRVDVPSPNSRWHSASQALVQRPNPAAMIPPQTRE